MGEALGRAGAGEEIMFVLAREVRVWTSEVIRGVTCDGLAWSTADEAWGMIDVV